MTSVSKDPLKAAKTDHEFVVCHDYCMLCIHDSYGERVKKTVIRSRSVGGRCYQHLKHAIENASKTIIDLIVEAETKAIQQQRQRQAEETKGKPQEQEAKEPVVPAAMTGGDGEGEEAKEENKTGTSKHRCSVYCEVCQYDEQLRPYHRAQCHFTLLSVKFVENLAVVKNKNDCDGQCGRARHERLTHELRHSCCMECATQNMERIHPDRL